MAARNQNTENMWLENSVERYAAQEANNEENNPYHKGFLPLAANAGNIELTKTVSVTENASKTPMYVKKKVLPMVACLSKIWILVIVYDAVIFKHNKSCLCQNTVHFIPA